MKRLKQKIDIEIATFLSLILILSFASFALASEINSENVIRYVNEARRKEGLTSLKASPKLKEVATLKANDMVTNKYFAHTSPQGITPWYWFEKVGYDYRYAGENLAINFITAEDQQEAWMNSPTHRKNILNVDYQEIGVAVVAGEINGQEGIITVQEFGTLVTPAQIGSDPENFSAQNKNATMERDVKFAPSVLSVKNSNSNNGLVKIDYTFSADKFIANDDLLNIVLVVVLVVMVLPFMIIQLVPVSRLIKLTSFKHSMAIKK
ncbi:MAG: CAP domain-containing protein [Candidatus Moraniibacteriota bacterium]